MAADIKNSNHPLQGLYLLRYGRDELGLDHTKSIYDPREEPTSPDTARLLEASTMKRKMSADPAARALYTDTYVADRADMEKYMEAEGRKKGLSPENSHPLYFILHHDPDPKPPILRGGVVIAIPAEQVPVELMTATMDDSFYNMPDKPAPFRLPEHGIIYSPHELSQRIKVHGWLPHDGHGQRYYEVQLWSRRVDDFMNLEATRPTKYRRAENNNPKRTPES